MNAQKKEVKYTFYYLVIMLTEMWKFWKQERSAVMKAWVSFKWPSPSTLTQSFLLPLFYIFFGMIMTGGRTPWWMLTSWEYIWQNSTFVINRITCMIHKTIQKFFKEQRIKMQGYIPSCYYFNHLHYLIYFFLWIW